MGLNMRFCEVHCGLCAAMQATWKETPTWQAMMAPPERPYCGGEHPDECSKCMEELEVDSEEEFQHTMEHITEAITVDDLHGQVHETHSISAGLDYPGVGPEHSYLKDSGRAQYLAVTDSQALEGFHALSRTEGIIPALEPSHAVYYACQLARQLPPEETILVCLSGRGDKDINIVAQAAGIEL